MERNIGDEDTFTSVLWAAQYVNLDAKTENGESFKMVKKRMQEAIVDILSLMSEGQTVAVVSHATAICAYLQYYCEIEVMDPSTKQRRISWQGKLIHEGTIETPSCFILNFDKDLIQISYRCL